MEIRLWKVRGQYQKDPFGYFLKIKTIGLKDKNNIRFLWKTLVKGRRYKENRAFINEIDQEVDGPIEIKTISKNLQNVNWKLGTILWKIVWNPKL